MTLLLSLVSHDYAIQVADQRILLAGQLIDTVRNKTVVYDGRYLFSYTGLAEISGVDTDQWIARAVIGDSLLSAIAARLQRLAQREYLRNVNRHHPLIIVGTGWDQNADDGFLSAGTIIVSNCGSSGRCQPVNPWFEVCTTALGLDRRYDVGEFGQQLTVSECEELHRSLRAAMRSRQEPRVLGRIMADCVRKVARRNVQVGSNVFVACIPRVSVSLTAPRVTVVCRRLLPDAVSVLYVPGEEIVVDSPERALYDLLLATSEGWSRGAGLSSTTVSRNIGR